MGYWYVIPSGDAKAVRLPGQYGKMERIHKHFEAPELFIYIYIICFFPGIHVT